jgi:hypothetical protein
VLRRVEYVTRNGLSLKMLRLRSGAGEGKEDQGGEAE